MVQRSSVQCGRSFHPSISKAGVLGTPDSLTERPRDHLFLDYSKSREALVFATVAISLSLGLS